MANHRVLWVSIISCLLCSCNYKKADQLTDTSTEEFLTELALGYWDLNYKFPISYCQARDTQAWFFSQYSMIDRTLLDHASEITYTDLDTTLLITYQGDTLAMIELPCSCDWTDEIPFGPRAYDSRDDMIMNDFIQVGENSYQEHLTYDLVNNIYPYIEERMDKVGFKKVQDDEKSYPQYLLVEYFQTSNSIQLIKACEKYSCYFHVEYASILCDVFSEYCKNNNVSRLLTPVEIYVNQ